MSSYLQSTYFVDFNHPLIQQKVHDLVQDLPETAVVEKVSRIFYFLRDGIKYRADPDWNLYSRKNTKASAVLERGYGYCIQKSALFCAMIRAIGLPARFHFVDIINYLTPQKFIDKVGSNLFIYHGYGEVFLKNKWLQANIAFDKELCERKGYPVVEFDGIHPSLFAHTNTRGDLFIDYLKDRGTYADIPYYRILLTWYIEYGIKNRFKGKKQK
jgi:transglutaminase-like putative cysteine protease